MNALLVSKLSRNWFVDPAYADMVLEDLERLDISASDGGADAAEMTYSLPGNGVALLRLKGAMTKEPHCMMRYFDTFSSRLAGEAALRAEADPNVQRIVLHIEGPGGDVSGTFEFGEVIRGIRDRGVKPIDTFIEDQCCSALLWIAAQTRTIAANKPAIIGSIGCVALIMDRSKAAEAAGVTVYMVSSGPYKGLGVDSRVPVTEAQLEKTQRLVDTHASMFVDALASGRNRPVEEIQKLATGEVWFADEAKELGLIDEVTTLEAFLATSSVATSKNKKSTRSTTGGKSMGLKDEIMALLDGHDADDADNKPKPKSQEPGVQGYVMAQLVERGISSVEQVNALFDAARVGGLALTEARDYAKKQANRRYGAEKGPIIGARIDAASYEDVVSSARAWEIEADEKFGVGKDGTSGNGQQRLSAPTEQPTVGVNAEAGHVQRETKDLMGLTSLGQRAMKDNGGKG